MAYRVLIVDDSAFYRRRLSSMLEQDPNIVVVGQAVDGKDAIAKTAELQPDVITMDVEMPVMDGISAVSAIMQNTPTPILMFSSLTHSGAQETLDALAAGAIDFLPKKFDEISKERPEAIRLLQHKLKSVARSRRKARVRQPLLSSSKYKLTKHGVPDTTVEPLPPSGKHYKLLVVGASTGGPVALQTVISALPANFAHPVLLVQHMPSTFTKAFAERLDKYSKISVSLAKDGDRLKPGHAYLAEGGKQMSLTGKGIFSKIKISDAPRDQKLHFHPSIDFTLASVAQSFAGEVLFTVLTGMGSDGASGAKQIKLKGATVWAQDEATSVIYGMPKAVGESGVCDRVIPLDNIAKHIIVEMKSS
ncbi:chemotaxis response regulator protein-glutamate methylesterase [Glaciecola sp. MH2013]|uniref:protein-glutamate methylesterase/protein-glutamine glutaminase n=1 Tax=Glaciecola sp. MH2013 TaxID=2785524 RepID=UPI0018A03AC5|nr:chemotaxis response regulator protein-glutamate methylesterase [Glaciecola sp. MH2013]MBF7072392.1 chemotaxis response regulator protein-glutamate methylesterase [Glaciecola sp. MH2013]